MTRINIIPVKFLTDQHLLAEYREITRVSKLARTPKQNETFPTEYRLGTGHVKFFYNKGAYLQRRTAELYQECCERDFDVQEKLGQNYTTGTTSTRITTPHPRRWPRT